MEHSEPFREESIACYSLGTSSGQPQWVREKELQGLPSVGPHFLQILDALPTGADPGFHSPSLGICLWKTTLEHLPARPLTCRGLASAAAPQAASRASCSSWNKWASSGRACSWPASGGEWTALGTSRWQGFPLRSLHIWHRPPEGTQQVIQTAFSPPRPSPLGADLQVCFYSPHDFFPSWRCSG